MPATLDRIREFWTSILDDEEAKLADRMKAAEFNAQMLAFQNRRLAHIPLGDNGIAGNRHHFRFQKGIVHSFFAFFRLKIRAKKPLMVGLLVASITRISTMA